VRLDNSVAAIVTGGASGLGEAAVRGLAATGARVTIFDVDVELGERLAREVRGRFAPVNVADDQQVQDQIERAESAHGVARVVINCAGIAPAARTVSRENIPHALDTFRRVIEVNLVGTFNVMSKAAARIAAAPRIGEENGVFIATASVAAFEGQVGQVAYAASKGGVAAMTLPLARDLAVLGVRVVTIAPGLFLTPMLRGLPTDVQQSLGQQAPFPARLGEPAEYAMLAQSIVANPMLNGETIRLDGAIRMPPK
jgi:NAD(P)-dependent dehydrogenase (short-subunit alcohol dehydrogenase family)